MIGDVDVALTEEIKIAKTDEEAEICVDVMLAEAGVETVEVIKVVVTTGKEAVAKVIATEEEAANEVVPMYEDNASSKIVFLFFCGGVKSMSQMRAKGKLLNMGGSQEQGSDVQDKFFLICELASNVNRRAATCEHASPSPAMQLQ